jgi:hypothetical protein
MSIRAAHLYEHNEAMAKILQAAPAMHNYLSELEGNWELHKVLFKKLRLYGAKSDNVVEQQFSWCLEERFLPFSLFLPSFFRRLFEKVSNYKTSIEDRAVEVFTARVAADMKKVQSHHDLRRPFKVTITNATEGKVSVVELSSGKTFAVHMTNPSMKCSCADYWEYGYPCGHAYAAIQALNWFDTKGPSWYYSTAVFTSDCFQSAVENMFVDVPSLLGTLPCDADIGQEIERGGLRTNITYAERTIKDVTVSLKRHLSRGEKMGIRKRTNVQKKSKCPLCFTFLGTTYLNKKGEKGHQQGGPQCMKNRKAGGHSMSPIGEDGDCEEEKEDEVARAEGGQN